MSWGELFVGPAVHGASCPWDKLSVGRVGHGASCLWGEMTVGLVVIGRVVRGASFDGASCPGIPILLANISVWLSTVKSTAKCLTQQICMAVNCEGKY
jgi:hypothetical protein